MRSLFALLLLPFATTACAAPPAPTAEELARTFRNLILPNLPNPLVEQIDNWGHQELVIVGIKWEKKGILLKPEPLRKLHNDGVWRKLNATALNPEKTLDLRVKDVVIPEPGRLTFAMTVQMPVNIKFEQQLWRKGVRIYSGETRARCMVILHLSCESTSRFEKKPGALLPDLVMRLRVKEARMNYYDLTVEHTAGVGGDLAKLFGEGVIETVKAFKPNFEKHLLEKANAAIVKAGDTKEVRLGLGSLLSDK